MNKLLFSLMFFVVGVSCSNNKIKPKKEAEQQKVNNSVNQTEQQTGNETYSQFAYVKLLVKDLFIIGDTTTSCSDIIEIRTVTLDTLQQIVDGYVARIKFYAQPSSVNIISQKYFVFDTYNEANEDRRKNCGK